MSGPAFSGILPMLERQDGYPPIGQAGRERPILKLIMVHGVGTHVPGYGARLSANLAWKIHEELAGADQAVEIV